MSSKWEGKKSKSKIIVFGVLGIIFFVWAGFVFSNKDAFWAFSSLNRGINFLYKNQLDYGEFKTFACKAGMQNCVYGSSPYVTAFVLQSLDGMNGRKVATMKNKGLDFLKKEQLPGGLWAVYSSRNKLKIIPDVDDTAVISSLLIKNNISVENNIESIRKSKNKNGLFYTWIEKGNIINELLNTVDCVVNMDVLRYLKEDDPLVCDYVNDAIKAGKNCSLYSDDIFVVYFIAARSYKEGIMCLGENKNTIIEAIKKTKDQKGFFENDLQEAYAMNSLMDFGDYSSYASEGILDLVKKQGSDGAWKIANFFSEGHSFGGKEIGVYNGSKELTTALALEAINKYAQHEYVSTSQKALKMFFSFFQ